MGKSVYKLFIATVVVVTFLSNGLLFFAPAANAQEKTVIKKRIVRKKKPKVVYQKDELISFEDEVVRGKVLKPDGFFLLRRKPKKWDDLIKVRKNFEPELKEMKYEL